MENGGGMKGQRLALFVVIVTVMSSAEAGRIYGSLQLDGQAVAKATKIVITCSGTPFDEEVQEHGRYSINVAMQGTCTFSIEGYPGAKIDIVSYAEATRYNFAISRNGNIYTMKRK